MSDPATAPPQRKCEHCGKSFQTMIAMEPGRDGKWWWLCVRDWKDGATPIGQAEEKAKAA